MNRSAVYQLRKRRVGAEPQETFSLSQVAVAYSSAYKTPAGSSQEGIELSASEIKLSVGGMWNVD